MTECYVGLMSGTSMDGIDAVVVAFGDASIDILATHTKRYPDAVREALLNEAAKPLSEPIDVDGQLHGIVGECFRDAAIEVIAKSDASDITAIGSHGQTLRHCPDAAPPFSLQIGDADIIAAGTGIETIADFRSADMRAGGQGAPLVPPFHEWLFRSADTTRVVVNIGGISNVTILPAGNGAVTGFDTGPGNGLMDAWIRMHKDVPFDDDGRWADEGRASERLLAEFLADPYFGAAPPKSTGFEYFNLPWVDRHPVADESPVDVQASLCELTAATIANAIAEHAPGTEELFVCGGGAHNTSLMRRLHRHLPGAKVDSTAALGLDPDWVEACAFAWLARATHNGQPGNLPSVTGAGESVVLGEIHSPQP